MIAANDSIGGLPPMSVSNFGKWDAEVSTTEGEKPSLSPYGDGSSASPYEDVSLSPYGDD